MSSTPLWDKSVLDASSPQASAAKVEALTVSFGPACDRFVAAFAGYASQSDLLLAFLTYVGALLGRSTYARLRAEPVFPNSFAILQAEPPLHLLDALVEPFGSPLIIRGGIYKVESLVYPLRDELVRPEKKASKPGDEPEFHMGTLVDEGTSKRQVILAQASLLTAISGKTANALALLSALLAAWRGLALSSWVGYPVGGFLRSASPHLGVLVSCPRKLLHRLPPDFAATCLFGWDYGSYSPPFGGPPDPELLLDVQSELAGVLPPTKGEIEIDPGALRIIGQIAQGYAPEYRAIVEIVLVKLSLIRIVLTGAATITEMDAEAAGVVFKNSHQTRFQSETEAHARRVFGIASRILDELLAANPGGLTRTAIGRLFSGNIGKGLLDEALASLVASGYARCEHPTSGHGRCAEVYYLRGDRGAV